MPPRYRSKVHQLNIQLRKHLNAGQRSCRDPAAHKNFFVSPKVLQRHSIPFHIVVQRPGDLILTLPDTYHEGFNVGINVCSAVNFADAHWLLFRAAYFQRLGKNMACLCQDCNSSETFRALNGMLSEEDLPPTPVGQGEFLSTSTSFYFCECNFNASFRLCFSKDSFQIINRRLRIPAGLLNPVRLR